MAAGGRLPALLPGRRQLAALEARLRGLETNLTAEQREFLARARRRRRAQRGQRRAGWLAGALILALIAELGTFLVQQSRVSAQQAAEGRSRTLAIQSDELTKTVSGGRLQLFRLDPALWERRLCKVLGRGLTADERGSLPAELCPAAQRQCTATS
ncbi:hypothetical protein AB0F11_34275 [Streptomyces sp. NPDC032472]|uniref:hypothetical protein n=1 Tax=Streptomyces sp. NPDC032472 TaxID=3155018 RepID=UPI0033D61509